MLLKDTNDARVRETQIVTSDKAPLLNKLITPILALGLLGITFTLFGIVLFQANPIDPSRKDILIYILGVLSAVATQVVSYYFGSSVGSKEKTDAMKEAMK
jgi:phosphotransferase system  glucose/maltose/N-acetylglucosamine-specific IIC component